MTDAKASPPAPEGLEDAVEAARAELADAISAGGLRRDPLRFVLSALSSALSVFPAAVRRVEAAAETVRQPLSAKAEAELLRRVEGAARRGAMSAGPSIQYRSALLVGTAVGAAAALGAAAGWSAGRTSMNDEVALAERALRTSLAAAEAWIPILQANPDPRPAIARGQVFKDDRTGWRVGTLTLYLERGNSMPQPARR